MNTTLSPEWVRAQMSITGMRTWRELRGEACIGFEDGFQAKQSICTSRSFATEIYEFDALAEQVAKFASMTAEKLRRQHSACNQMTVFAWTNRFKEDWTSNRGNSCVTAFETATDSSIEMVKASRAALGEIFARGCGYKKAGVIATSIIPKDGVQANLFGETDIQRHDRLMRAMDAINGRLGHDSVIVASQGFGDVRNQHQYRSPRYTTEWSDIPTVSL